MTESTTDIWQDSFRALSPRLNFSASIKHHLFANILDALELFFFTLKLLMRMMILFFRCNPVFDGKLAPFVAEDERSHDLRWWSEQRPLLIKTERE